MDLMYIHINYIMFFILIKNKNKYIEYNLYYLPLPGSFIKTKKTSGNPKISLRSLRV